MATARLLKTTDDGLSTDTLAPMGGPWQSGVYRGKKKATTPGATPAPVTTPVASPAAAPGQRSGATAKNVEFDKPGAGNAMVGINADNVYSELDRLRADRENKAGGSKQSWENLTRFTSTPNASHLAPDQASAFNDYIGTGKRSANLKTETVLAATDWTFRDVGRSQQHKPKGFLDSVIGQILVTAAEVAAGALTGGAAIPALIGAGVGYARGGVKGAIFGGISGAAAGSAGSSIGTAVGSGSLTAPASGAGITATGGGGAASAANVGANVVSGIRTAASGFSLSTAASAVSAAVGVRELLAGAAGAGVVAATATTPGGLDKSSVVTPPPAVASAGETEAEAQRRRRAVVRTDLTWGRTLNAPLLSKPTLLGGPTRLAA